MTKKNTSDATSTDATEATDHFVPAKADVDAFAKELDKLVMPKAKFGLGVSGGPDSVAMLLLAAAARPGMIEAATVDHALRDGSAAEAEWVAALCAKLGVPHETLTIEWENKPTSAIQERSRMRRYRALSAWAKERGLKGVAVAHHADDQSETVLMRLARGSGVQGLAGIRALRPPQADNTTIIRPVLGFSHARLVGICEAAGIEPIHDPSNDDPNFERVKVRQTLGATEWLDPQMVSRAASNLQAAERALSWATRQEWQRRVTEVDTDRYSLDHVGLPDEIARRIVHDIIMLLRTEGGGWDIRGRELDMVMATLQRGRPVTLGGVLCINGPAWRFERAKPRRPVGKEKEAATS